MELSFDYVGQFADQTELIQSKHGRYQPNPFGSANVSPNGHPQNSGVLDTKTLCTFQANDPACTRPARNSNVDAQRAVRRMQINGTIKGSFRCWERYQQSKINREWKRASARCANLFKQA